MSKIELWRPQTSVTIPESASTVQEISRYAKQLSVREAEQIIAAFEARNFEMGSVYIWQKTMTSLKKQLASLGLDFVGELLERPDINADSSVIQVLTDYDALRLAEELGMFSTTQAMRLRVASLLISHFSSSNEEDEDDDDRQMSPEEAIQCLKTCVQNVLGKERLEGALEFAEFRNGLESKVFDKSDQEIQKLLVSPYFFQRTTLRVLMALTKTAQGAQVENALANVNVIVPLLWDSLRKPDRWLIGRAYAEVFSEGRNTAVSGIRKALLRVKGFDYVPESLRSKTFIAAAESLVNTHFSHNNYHNEPSVISKLSSLGTTIPMPAFAQCMTAILCVRLGNTWGISWAAKPISQEILKSQNEEQWHYYLNECLPGDDIILEKLMEFACAKRWIEVVLENELSNVEVADLRVRRLMQVKNGQEQTVIAAAKTLHTLLKSG